MINNAFKLVEQNRLSLSLTPLPIRELFFIKILPADLYIFSNGLFQVKLTKGSYLTKDVIKDLLITSQGQVFIDNHFRPMIVEMIQENLRKATQTLSLGDPLKNLVSQINLLTLNLSYLYENPSNDNTLGIHYQSTRNLFNFLSDLDVSQHKKMNLYQEIKNHKFHYTLGQPILSSLLVFYFLKQVKIFNVKEVEMLFITSIFKDIGMSLIEGDKFQSEKLSTKDKQIFQDHGQKSFNILNGRIPLGTEYLSIIQNHHLTTTLVDVNSILETNQNDRSHGFESVLLNMMDIVCAMTSDRPYRKAENLFSALDLIRRLIGKEYPTEFKILVKFFQKFSYQ